MTYLIARNGRVAKVTNVKEVKESFVEWIFIKEDNTVETYTKFSTDFLGRE